MSEHRSFERFVTWLFLICGIILMVLGAARFLFHAILFLFGAFLFNKALLDMGKPSLGVYFGRLWDWIKKEVASHF